MSPSFLLTKLFRINTVAVYSTTNSSTFSGLFLRRISSNTSCAAADSVSSTKRLAKSTLITSKELNRDYTVSYLVESCGLSPNDALSASEKIHFSTPERPNSFLDLLSNHGFTSTQITKIVRTRPGLLGIDAQKIILPKLEYFQSIGVSKLVLAQVLSYNPTILTTSLKKQIQPVCELIRNFMRSDKNFCSAIKASPRLLSSSHEKRLLPNIAILQELGMPGSSLSLLFTHFSRTLERNPKQLSAGVSKVKEMGFDPSKSTFVLAMSAIVGKGKKPIWDRCYKIYSTKWGWSEEDILSAFRKHPHCMTLSEKKIESTMEYLVNTMGWSSKCIAHSPYVLLYSLEKRIIPRCSVIRVLWTKGLLSKDLRPYTVLNPVEKDFLKKYVTRFEQQVPQLLSAYKGKMDTHDL